MPSAPDWSEHEADDRLPEKLVQDLKRLYAPPGAVPPKVDDAIGEAAWRHCDEVRVRRRIRWWSCIAAAAAAVFLIFWFRDLWQRPSLPSAAVPSSQTRPISDVPESTH